MHVEVNGARIFFDVEGPKLVPDGPGMRERPTLLLLSGNPLDHTIFRPQLDELVDVAQLVYVDYRGNGRSTGDDPSGWNRQQFARDVHDFCETVGIERPVVLGYSAGATVAIAYASAYPTHPGGLVLYSGTATSDRSASFDMFERLGGPQARAAAVARWADPTPTPEVRAEFVRICFPLYMRRATASPDRVARMMVNPAVWAEFERTGAVRDQRAELGAIRCPTLILAGENDPAAPPAQSRMLAAALPPGLGRLMVCPNTGHAAHIEDPEWFLAAVRGFLRDISA